MVGWNTRGKRTRLTPSKETCRLTAQHSDGQELYNEHSHGQLENNKEKVDFYKCTFLKSSAKTPQPLQYLPSRCRTEKKAKEEEQNAKI